LKGGRELHLRSAEVFLQVAGDSLRAGEGWEDIDETKHLDAENLIPHAPIEYLANPELFLKEGRGLSFNQLVKPLASLFHTPVEGGGHRFPPCWIFTVLYCLATARETCFPVRQAQSKIDSKGVSCYFFAHFQGEVRGNGLPDFAGRRHFISQKGRVP